MEDTEKEKNNSRICLDRYNNYFPCLGGNSVPVNHTILSTSYLYYFEHFRLLKQEYL